MNTAKCPYCDKPIDRARWEGIELSTPRGETVASIVISCFNCDKALSITPPSFPHVKGGPKGDSKGDLKTQDGHPWPWDK